VGAEAVEHGRVRNRSLPGRHVSDCNALAGGADYPHVGCLLELVENEKLVMTSALAPGYRPAPDPVAGVDLECAHIPFTAILTLEEHAGKTAYSVLVLHKDEAGRKRHEEMGFHEGWNMALDQLIEVVQGLGR